MPNPMAAAPASRSARRPISSRDAPPAAAAASAVHATPTSCSGAMDAPTAAPTMRGMSSEPAPLRDVTSPIDPNRHPAIQGGKADRPGHAGRHAEEHGFEIRDRRAQHEQPDEQGDETGRVRAGNHDERSGAPRGDRSGEVAGTE